MPVAAATDDEEVDQQYHRFTEPEFQKWEKQVAALPARQQVQAVAMKLQELNSTILSTGFDGTVTHKIEKGIVTELGFSTDKVADIAPVRALKQLKKLQCGGTWAGPTTLSDLSPLAGMKLTHLELAWTRVDDLSPLHGMLLTDLDLRGAKIDNLSALQGMPLRNLNCMRTSVSDLTPLAGMPLINLDCQSTRVKDVKPLHSTKLQVLVCTNSPVADLSPLEGLPLTYLNCHQTSVSDLAPLKSIPITQLYCDIQPNRDEGILRSIKTLEIINNKRVADFWADLLAEKEVETVVRKLQQRNPGFDGKITYKIEKGVVTELQFVTDNVTDISPVTVLSGLKVLDCAGSGTGLGKLSDLTPLTGMTLSVLLIMNTKVTDLSPVHGMPLTHVDMWNTPVSNLTPLKGMNLKLLQCGSTRVTDLSPLSGMPLVRVICDFNRERDTEILRSIKTLEQINSKPTVEFWMEVEERQSGTKP